ncbi:MAG: DNA repair protein RecN [Flavobacteriaceae bacterium]
MLSFIHIKNYALIDELKVHFQNGLTTITGETGAGKSILLGGLSLVLGKRVDFSNIKNKTKKSIIECVFQIDSYNLKHFFEANDLDYESETILRREVLPSGKSRAFVNDSPVNLTILQLLGSHLIDIHSQHDNLSLTTNSFQFQIIDALADNSDLLQQYAEERYLYSENSKALIHLKDQRQQLKKEFDYNNFLLNELEESNVLHLSLEDLEVEYATLNNVEFIQSELSFSQQILGEQDRGVIANLMALKQRFQNLKTISNPFEEILNRINSTTIELDDIFSEIERQLEDLEINPERLNVLDGQLKRIQNLFNKHNVSSIEELLTIHSTLQQKTLSIDELDNRILSTDNLLHENLKKLNKISKSISKKREGILPKLEVELHDLLQHLGMPQAEFKIRLSQVDDFLSNGKDQLSFLLKTNKGSEFLPISKGASGGELSRIMLAIKYILSKHQQLPTVMFDEIDTGVSGEISNKMAILMQEMSAYMQVFAITHLPQIAAKGAHHFKIYKSVDNDSTLTKIKALNPEERLLEIAQMLGGTQHTKSAKAHAKQLLN